MASESLTPPPSGGGYAKYLIVLLLLVGGGLGAYFATRKEPERPAPQPVQNVERPTSITQDTVEIPADEPEEPDAGVVAAVEPVKKPRAPAGDPWSCQGELEGSAAVKVLSEGQSAIRSCYERELRNDNQLQGDVRLQVRVGNDGKVTLTRVTGNLKDTEVKTCMQTVARGWTFPAPSGGTCAVVDVPFKFRPKN